MKKLRFVEGSRGGEPFAELQFAPDKWDASHMLQLHDLFPAGPDGRRHPTREDLLQAADMVDNESGSPEVVTMLRALATVAPKED